MACIIYYKYLIGNIYIYIHINIYTYIYIYINIYTYTYITQLARTLHAYK